LARLYIKHETDLSKSGHRAHQRCRVVVTFGSAQEPRLLIALDVNWKVGEEKPTVDVILGGAPIRFGFEE